MFGATLTALFTVLLIYVLWRAASVPWVAKRVPGRRLAAAGALVWILFYVGRAVGHGGSGPAAAALELAGMSILGALLLFFVSMLAADLATVFGFAFRRFAPAIRGWALLVGAALTLAALVQGFLPPAIVSYEVKLPGLPSQLDGTVLVAISDTHVGQLLGSRWLEARVAQIHAIDPDLVALVGDIFEGHGRDPAGSLETLRGLRAPLGVWFVNGNHEGYGAREQGSDLLERAGFTRLTDRWAVVSPGLVLAGVDDLTARRHRNESGDPMGAALAGHPPGAVVLLSHTPWDADRAREAGAGLMISGHTHGGQIWPFNHLVATRYPLTAGRYDVGGMTVLVSRGAGTWGPRMRLWRRGEILKITLLSRGQVSRNDKGDATS